MKTRFKMTKYKRLVSRIALSAFVLIALAVTINSAWAGKGNTNQSEEQLREANAAAMARNNSQTPPPAETPPPPPPPAVEGPGGPEGPPFPPFPLPGGPAK